MNTASFQIPALTKVNKFLLIGVASFFVLNSISAKMMGRDLIVWFGLSLEGMLSGHIFELITYPFFPRNLLEFLFDSMVIWFIGSDLEDKWGMKRYISFILTVTLGAALFYMLAQALTSTGQIVLSGPSVWALSLCFAFGIIFPERTMYFLFFPVKAKYFVMILIAISLYNGVFSPMGILAWGQMGSFICAWLWMIFEAKKSPFKGFSPKKRNSGHLQLVKDKDEKEKKKITYH